MVSDRSGRAGRAGTDYLLADEVEGPVLLVAGQTGNSMMMVVAARRISGSTRRTHPVFDHVAGCLQLLGLWHRSVCLETRRRSEGPAELQAALVLVPAARWATAVPMRPSYEYAHYGALVHATPGRLHEPD